VRRLASLQDLRQVRTYQIAPFVQAECIALGAVAVQLFFPFHHVCLAPVFLDEPADAIAAFAAAFGAFDAEHVELTVDVAKDEVSPPTHDGILSVCYERQEISDGQKPTESRRKLVEFDAQTWHAEPPLTRVHENVSGACRRGVPRSVAQIQTADRSRAALRESVKVPKL
jgi:hypothetical protein